MTAPDSAPAPGTLDGMPAKKQRHAYSYEEYLLLEADAPSIRHEFVDGEILAMAGGSELHSALIAAVTGELYQQLRGTPCGVRDSNMRVRVFATGNAFYCDAAIVCGQAEIVHELLGGDSLVNPAVIVEVLSPSTENYDRGEKFEDNYRHIPALGAYVLVAQDEPSIEVRSRSTSGSWEASTFGPGQKAPIPGTSCTLDVDTIYREARKNAPGASDPP